MLLATLTKDAELVSPPIQSEILKMLGVLLFCLFFTFLCVLIRFPTSQTNQAWWIKVVTEAPQCTYYFGPFDSTREAELAKAGYIEDLEQEGAKKITVFISQSQPKTLTVCEEEG